MKSFSLAFFILFFLNANGQSKKPDYIRLEFVYEHTERQLSTVFFFVDSPKIKVDPIYYDMIKVSAKEFAAMENVITTKSSYLVIDSLAEIYYEIDVVKKGKKTVFGTVNLHKTMEIFDKILEVIQHSENYLRTKQVFEYLKSNLKPKGILRQ